MKKKITLLTIALLSSFSLIAQTFVVNGLTYCFDETKGTVAITQKPDCGVDMIITATPKSGYIFTQWSDGNTDNPRTLTLTQDVTLTALFTQSVQFTYEGVIYKTTSANTVEVSSSNYGKYSHPELHIPATVTDPSTNLTYKVTSIADMAFMGNQCITSVTLGENIEKIGAAAFSDCPLTSIIIPSNTKVIRDDAFTYAKSLTTVVVKAVTPPSYELVLGGYHFFEDCPITSIIVPCGSGSKYTSASKWKDYKTKIHECNHTFIIESANPAFGTVAIDQYPTCSSSSATITATPQTGFTFIKWSDGNTSNPRTFTVDADTHLTALFEPITKPTITVSTNTNISSLSWKISNKTYSDLTPCDIIVTNGATLTCDAMIVVGTDMGDEITCQAVKTVDNITVHEGSMLKIADDADLVITGTLTAHSKDDTQPQFLKEIDGSITYGNFQFIKQIPADRYYFFSLPFASNTSTVTIDNGAGGYKNATYNSDWNYLYYDGAAFAQNPSNDSFWYTANAGTINATKGYAVGVDGRADTYRELTFTANGTVDFSMSGTRSIAVTENPLRADYVHPDKETFKGWNFIFNPYTSTFRGTISIPGVSDEALVTIPDAGQNKTYTSKSISEVELPPFFGFFVQTAKAGNVVFTPNSGAKAPRKEKDAQDDIFKVGVVLSNGAKSDETSLVIGNQFTNKYEIGSDLMKMIGYGDKPQVYTYDANTKYAFHSMNETAAAQVQPLGVYLPATGEYTFSLKDSYDNSCVQALYLYDYETNTCTNLVETEYTFTSGTLDTEKRFAIAVTLAPQTTTAIPTDATTLFSVHQDGTHITLQGVTAGDKIRIINVQGQVVAQWTATDSTLTGTLPHSGLYIIERTSATGVQVNKIILQ